MKTEIFTLCDTAQEYMGKAVIVGTINELKSQTFPVSVPNMSLVVRLASDPEEIIHPEIKLTAYNINNPDKKIITLNVPIVTNGSDKSRRNFLSFMLKLDGLPIPEEGTYKFEIKIGEWSDNIELYVIKN